MSYHFKKILKIFHRIICKIVDFLIPFLFKLFLFARIQSRILDILTRLRSNVHFNENYKFLISKILKKKLIALDVGAQGGFFNTGLFHPRYNNYFSPILVEPIAAEAEKIKSSNYKVISKGLWSKKCTKILYFLEKRPGSSSMFEPNKKNLNLYGFKKKNYHLFDVTKKIKIKCETLKSSLQKLNIKFLDYLKIDTQGAEYEILKGIGNFFPLLVRLEVHTIPMYKNAPYWCKVINYMHQLGYIVCDWQKIGSHVTRSPVEMDIVFIPNYLTKFGKELIKNRVDNFISLMLVFGHVSLLRIISENLNFSLNKELKKLNDKYFF
jgi:FkbM family methyltransferase